VHPVVDGADITKANVIGGLIRHIENFSQAAIAYDTGGESAVTIGWGYCAASRLIFWRRIPWIRN